MVLSLTNLMGTTVLGNVGTIGPNDTSPGAMRNCHGFINKIYNKNKVCNEKMNLKKNIINNTKYLHFDRLRLALNDKRLWVLRHLDGNLHGDGVFSDLVGAVCGGKVRRLKRLQGTALRTHREQGHLPRILPRYRKTCTVSYSGLGYYIITKKKYNMTTCFLFFRKS